MYASAYETYVTSTSSIITTMKCPQEEARYSVRNACRSLGEGTSAIHDRGIVTLRAISITSTENQRILPQTGIAVYMEDVQAIGVRTARQIGKYEGYAKFERKTLAGWPLEKHFRRCSMWSPDIAKKQHFDKKKSEKCEIKLWVVRRSSVGFVNEGHSLAVIDVTASAVISKIRSVAIRGAKLGPKEPDLANL
ncbi:hypothetical protein BDQ12DRAFT_662039 [Crucibulum laeve]|uniref:Uncharacterized protein n=1 Tax=Crucibulum laeve TaxID=68775 RepID=A0A5C3MDH5_9AGAR|nr:hypothetical protein BDQ12DRAFT_662039 [Crucibulum laeve]